MKGKNYSIACVCLSSIFFLPQKDSRTREVRPLHHCLPMHSLPMGETEKKPLVSFSPLFGRLRSEATINDDDFPSINKAVCGNGEEGERKEGRSSGAGRKEEKK